jgi:hypothetical protein
MALRLLVAEIWNDLEPRDMQGNKRRNARYVPERN